MADVEPVADDGAAGQHGRGRSVGLLAVLALLAGSLIVGEPQTWLRCLAESRDGWTIELPGREVGPLELTEVVRQQTPCVEVELTPVHTGTAEPGTVVDPRGPRTWVGSPGSLVVQVESPPDGGVGTCAPPPDEGDRAVCPTTAPPPPG